MSAVKPCVRRTTSDAKRPRRKRGVAHIAGVLGLLTLGAFVAVTFVCSLGESESVQLSTVSEGEEPDLPVTSGFSARDVDAQGIPSDARELDEECQSDATGAIALPSSVEAADEPAKLIALEGTRLEERANALGRSWSLVSVESLTKIVSDVLGDLDAGGFELLVAEKLDLFGAAWGCVALNTQERQVVLVYARPADEEASLTALAALVAPADESTLVTVVEIRGGG